MRRTFNPTLVQASYDGDTVVVRNLFETDEPIIVPDGNCTVDSDSDCGCCEDCMPSNPLNIAVENGDLDVVEEFLKSPKFPLTLLLDDCFFPRRDLPALAETALRVCHCRVTSQQPVLDLPEDVVRTQLYDNFVNDRDWFNQWKIFKTAAAAHPKGTFYQNVPPELRLDVADLQGGSSDREKVVDVRMGSECMTWAGTKCYHMVHVTRKGGHVRGHKDQGRWILFHYYRGYLSERDIEHLEGDVAARKDRETVVEVRMRTECMTWRGKECFHMVEVVCKGGHVGESKRSGEWILKLYREFLGEREIEHLEGEGKGYDEST
ncbi:hypothetical protein HK104_008362 [Borealophlyctis nickersoniae]|nr:hypothetical protein HK104_008362 [Borealophlyctis nickersoniae]